MHIRLEFFSNFDGRHSDIWNEEVVYSFLNLENDYLVLLTNECCDELSANSSWYQFEAPFEARVGLLNSRSNAVGNITFGSRNIYLQYILIGDSSSVNVSGLSDSNYDNQESSYIAIVYDSIVSKKRYIFTDTSYTETDVSDCDWSNDWEYTHEVTVIVDDNGLIGIKDDLCGISYGTHSLSSVEQESMSLGMYYNNEIITWFEEEYDINLNTGSNFTGQSFAYTLFDYVDFIQLKDDETFVTTPGPTLMPTIGDEMCMFSRFLFIHAKI